ncbi:hypothetical protein AAMO2058_001274600 [Amorphochlora amoebiformis]
MKVFESRYSLPPKVRNPVQGYVTVKCGKVLFFDKDWKGGKTAELCVLIQWWGQKKSEVARLNCLSSSFPETTHPPWNPQIAIDGEGVRFPVRASPGILSQYFKDMKKLVVRVVNAPNDRVVGTASISLSPLVSSRRSISESVIVTSEDGQPIAKLQLHICRNPGGESEDMQKGGIRSVLGMDSGLHEHEPMPRGKSSNLRSPALPRTPVTRAVSRTPVARAVTRGVSRRAGDPERNEYPVDGKGVEDIESSVISISELLSRGERLAKQMDKEMEGAEAVCSDPGLLDLDEVLVQNDEGNEILSDLFSHSFPYQSRRPPSYPAPSSSDSAPLPGGKDVKHLKEEQTDFEKGSSGVRSPILMGGNPLIFIYVAIRKARFNRPWRCYTSMQMFRDVPRTNSQISKLSTNPVFAHSDWTPRNLVYSGSSELDLGQKVFVVEVNEAANGRIGPSDELIGISKLYPTNVKNALAFVLRDAKLKNEKKSAPKRDNLYSHSQSARSLGKLAIFNGRVPIVDPISGKRMGVLSAAVFIGTQSQISRFHKCEKAAYTLQRWSRSLAEKKMFGQNSDVMSRNFADSNPGESKSSQSLYLKLGCIKLPSRNQQIKCVTLVQDDIPLVTSSLSRHLSHPIWEVFIPCSKIDQSHSFEFLVFEANQTQGIFWGKTVLCPQEMVEVYRLLINEESKRAAYNLLALSGERIRSDSGEPSGLEILEMEIVRGQDDGDVIPREEVSERVRWLLGESPSPTPPPSSPLRAEPDQHLEPQPLPEHQREAGGGSEIEGKIEGEIKDENMCKADGDADGDADREINDEAVAEAVVVQNEEKHNILNPKLHVEGEEKHAGHPIPEQDPDTCSDAKLNSLAQKVKPDGQDQHTDRSKPERDLDDEAAPSDVRASENKALVRKAVEIDTKITTKNNIAPSPASGKTDLKTPEHSCERERMDLPFLLVVIHSAVNLPLMGQKPPSCSVKFQLQTPPPPSPPPSPNQTALSPGQKLPNLRLSLGSLRSNHTHSVLSSRNPCWEYSRHFYLNSFEIHSPKALENYSLILQVVHNEGVEVIIGGVVVDLSPLAIGFHQIRGWYHIRDDFNAPKGQIFVSVTPSASSSWDPKRCVVYSQGPAIQTQATPDSPLPPETNDVKHTSREIASPDVSQELANTTDELLANETDENLREKLSHALKALDVLTRKWKGEDQKPSPDPGERRSPERASEGKGDPGGEGEDGGGVGEFVVTIEREEDFRPSPEKVRENSRDFEHEEEQKEDEKKDVSGNQFQPLSPPILNHNPNPNPNTNANPSRTAVSPRSIPENKRTTPRKPSNSKPHRTRSRATFSFTPSPQPLRKSYPGIPFNPGIPTNPGIRTVQRIKLDSPGQIRLSLGDPKSGPQLTIQGFPITSPTRVVRSPTRGLGTLKSTRESEDLGGAGHVSTPRGGVGSPFGKVRESRRLRLTRPKIRWDKNFRMRDQSEERLSRIERIMKGH